MVWIKERHKWMIMKHGRHKIHKNSYLDYIPQRIFSIFSCIRTTINLNLCKGSGDNWREIRRRHGNYGWTTTITWWIGPNEGYISYWNTVPHANILCITLHIFLINIILYDTPPQHNISIHFFFTRIFQLAPYLWR